MKYIALIVTGILWFAGCSKDFSTWLFENDYVKDDYRYGDLYRISNLRKFKEEREMCDNSKISQKDSIHLVLAGDSFTEKGRVDSSFFVARDYTYVRVDGHSKIELDTSQFNVLIIETVERHFRERFADVWNGVEVVSEIEKEIPGAKSLWRKAVDVKVPYSDELHESVLFGYDFPMWIRELKAELNYKLFGRVDKNVRLNKAGEHLLYYLPSEHGISSGFDEISDAEIEELVIQVNQTFEWYKKIGFDKVILSIIPNKTSILGTDLGDYNKLAIRIERNSNLTMEIIDIYEPFVEMGAKSYAKGDTHWSCSGLQIWVNEVNKKLIPTQETVVF